MTYCDDIKLLLSAHETIRIAATKYEGDERLSKYRIVAIGNHFIGKGNGKIDLAQFNKNRCNPPFTESEIASLTADVNNLIATLQNTQNAFNASSCENNTPCIDEQGAIAFLSNNPMNVIREQYFRLHYGDEDALSTVIWSFCVKWVETAHDEGIHIIAIGQRGSGKSHGITSGMVFLPPELTWIGGISARYLYYEENLARGISIYLDELPSEPTLIDSLKAIITAYPEGGKRGTVINGKAAQQSVPPRITIHTSSVDQKDDEQFSNRMTVIRSSGDKTNREERIKFRLKLYEGKVVPVDKETLCSIHNAMRHISSKVFDPILPEGAIVCNSNTDDARVFNQFVCAMFGNAILNYPKRTHRIEGNKIQVVVSQEDFDAIIHMYQTPDEYLLKLSHSTIAVKNYLENIFPEHRSVGEIAKAVSLDPEVVRRAIKGRTDRAIACLLNSGDVEEIMVTSQEKEIYQSSATGYEYTKPVGERIGSKAYRASRGKKKDSATNASDKKPDAPQTELSKIAAMVQWDQSKADAFVFDPPNPPMSSQSMGGSLSPLNNNTSSQSSQDIEGGDGNG